MFSCCGLLCWLHTALIVGAVVSILTYIGQSAEPRATAEQPRDRATRIANSANTHCAERKSTRRIDPAPSSPDPSLGCSVARLLTVRLCRLCLCLCPPYVRPVPFLLDGYYFKEQDLKSKYGAQWAVVTGSSSGIGRALTSKLAAQGINVVMVAIDDKLLTDVHAQMQKESGHKNTGEKRRLSSVASVSSVDLNEELFSRLCLVCVLSVSPPFSSARLA